MHSECLQNSSRQLEATMVGLEPQFFVGFDRIQPVVLEGIGLQLGHQANSPPFLLLVKENSSTRFRYEAERHFELLPAIAAQRAEHVSGEALGVDAHQRRRTVDIAQDQRYSFFGASSLEIAHKPMNAEMRPARRKIRLCKLSNRKWGRQLFGRRSFSRHSFIIATRTAPTPAAVSQFPFKGGCRRNGSRLEFGGISGIIGDARAGNMTPKGLIAIGSLVCGCGALVLSLSSHSISLKFKLRHYRVRRQVWFPPRNAGRIGLHLEPSRPWGY